MSVLKTGRATHSRIRGIFRYLLQAPKQRENKEKLTRLLSPDKLSEDKTEKYPMFNDSLKESIKCGLLIKDNDDIAINSDLSAEARNPKTGDKLLPDTLVKLLFASDNKDEEDLGRLIAWYLAREHPTFAISINTQTIVWLS